MVTDMFTKNTSDNSGIRPSIVVAAASTTGRTRLTQESSRASYGCLPLSICWSISSISTIAFLINRPINDNAPSNDMKSNAPPVPSRPTVIPTMASGTVSQMIAGWRSLPNRKMLVSIISRKPTGSDAPRPAWAFTASSYSPPHSS